MAAAKYFLRPFLDFLLSNYLIWEGLRMEINGIRLDDHEVAILERAFGELLNAVRRHRQIVMEDEPLRAVQSFMTKYGIKEWGK
jgi:hypothetical protein